MKDVKLAIVIPYFKSKYFRQTLRSLSMQTNLNFKVYIGNDASPECPESIINEFQNILTVNYKRFENNIGSFSLTEQWGRCLAMVKDEEWFLILGDDDQLTENTVEEFYRIISDATSARHHVLRMQRQIIDERGQVLQATTSYPDHESGTDFLYKRSLNLVGSSLGEYIFRVDDYKKFGIRKYPKAFYSDNMMVLEYSRFGKLKNLDNAYALIRISPDSLSGDETNKQFIKEAGWQFYEEIINKYSSNFSKKQLSLFLNILLGKVKSKRNKMSVVDYLKISKDNIGYLATFRKIITLLK